MPNPYPKGALKRLQEAELEILCVIDKLCRENDIDYFIDSGTLLGAVRHGGFIPWDDDADVGMSKEDYEHFCEIAPEALPQGYSLHTSANSSGFSALWAKVYKDDTRFIDDNCLEAGCEQGIFVDILPFCRISEDPRKAQEQCKAIRMAQIKSYLKHFSHPKLPKATPVKPLVMLGCKLVHSTIAHTWKQEDLQHEFDHAFDASESSGLWTSAAYPQFGIFAHETLFPTKDIQFEGLTLRAPHDSDAMLKTDYGDYLQLPPEDERYTHAPLILDFGDGLNVIDN